MDAFDPSLFLDIADALGIGSPAIVEKDYWATQFLKDVAEFSPKGYDLVFSGGTCLAKAHQNTFRMSEDIDFKMIPKTETIALSKNQQRQLRGEIHQRVIDCVENSDSFTLAAQPKKRNEGKYQQFLIEYPRTHNAPDVLRPHLQLDLTESLLLEAPVLLPISSLYASTLKQEKEINLHTIICL